MTQAWPRDTNIEVVKERLALKILTNAEALLDREGGFFNEEVGVLEALVDIALRLDATRRDGH